MSHQLETVLFSTYCAKDIRNISVKEVTNPETFDALLHPNNGGLYDSAFGPTDRDDLCDSCGQNYINCPGHFGHINLPVPVYHPVFFKLMLKILRGSCFQCHKLMLTKPLMVLYTRQMELLDEGNVTDAILLLATYNTALSDAGKSDVSTAEKHDNIIEVMKKACDSKIEPGIDDNANSRNATICRQQIIKELFHSLTGKVTKHCPHCASPVRKIRQEYSSRLYLMPVGSSAIHKTIGSKAMKDSKKSQDEFDKYIKQLSTQTFLTPVEVQSHMESLWANDQNILKSFLGSFCHPSQNKRVTTPEMFFLNAVAVTPNRFRPLSVLGDKRFENPQTASLNKVLLDVNLVTELLIELNSSEESKQIQKPELVPKRKRGQISVAGTTPAEKLKNAWIKLQTDVMCVMDSDLDKLSKEKLPGIRQLLEKKEGLFRKHMMGKRVNFAARSVISPDPFINTDEIGLPEVFACKLTYPQPVTPWNCQELRKAIINGPSVHPGAVLVENENGRKIILSATNPHQREALAKRLLTPSLQTDASSTPKKVHRHIKNGDVMLLNRQPTLHRPSMMAHKVRVLPKERTIRLHYANCKAYNADFDGDEMNAHFPQSELARAEAYNLGATNHHYLSPKDGKPLSGLIQDFMISGVRMTSREAMYSRNDYQHLVYSALIDKSGPVKTLKPCIMKPEQMWSGKQVVSTVLINIIPPERELINLVSKAKVTDMNWAASKEQKEKLSTLEDPHLLEMQVIFRHGELLTGLLDKTQYGATAYGLVHACYELYGGSVSGLLLSALGRLFTSLLQLTGFTLGVQDILVTEEADKKRAEFMMMAKESGWEAALKTFGLEDDTEKSVVQERLKKAHMSTTDNDMKQLDGLVKKETDHYQNSMNSACIPYGLTKTFPDNSLQLMVQSGAKGSAVNCMQISCLLGQIELEGRRPPLMISGRSLPSFYPYDTEPRAGGFVDGRFLTGIQPQEYFFHCMAGREGLIDTAVKTSRSGYLQRCLIKHLEGLRVQYDLTVRDGDGSIVQFLYGEDGLDIGKIAYLQESQFDFVTENYGAYLKLLNPSVVKEKIDLHKALEKNEKLEEWLSDHKTSNQSSSLIHTPRTSPFLSFEKRKRSKMESKYENSRSDQKNARTKINLKLVKSYQKIADEAMAKYEDYFHPKSEATSMFQTCATVIPTNRNYIAASVPCPDPVLSILSPDTHYGSISEKFTAKVQSFAEKSFETVKKEGCKEGIVNHDKFKSLLTLKYQHSLAEAGDAVGLLAGQSIGEPSTQMTLNTFHFAGRGEMNVTLGIPRLREILMTASAAIKTPTMELLIRPGKKARKRAIIMQKHWNKVCLSQLLKSANVYEMITSEFELKRERVRRFRVRLEFLPHSLYKDDYALNPEEILLYVEQRFLCRLANSVFKVIRASEKSRFMNASVQDSPNVAGNRSTDDGDGPSPLEEERDDDADVSDDDGEENGDASEAKQRSRRMQFSSYEEPEEEDLASGNQGSDAEDENDQGVRRESVDQSMAVDNDNINDAVITPQSSKEKRERIKSCIASHSNIVSYKYDDNEQLWCEATFEFPIINSKVMLVPLIESLSAKSVVNEVEGISRCLVSESSRPGERGKWRMCTEGVNIEQLWHYTDVINANTIYSNNIHAIASAYGIEAARQVIIKEIKDVFKAYGIEIDARHLSLVGDYMTFEGFYRPFNRIGIESNPFPFQKMSFETTTVFLRSACAFGHVDTLGSPSSRLIVGRAINAGTGSFELVQPIKL